MDSTLYSLQIETRSRILSRGDTYDTNAIDADQIEFANARAAESTLNVALNAKQCSLQIETHSRYHRAEAVFAAQQKRIRVRLDMNAAASCLWPRAVQTRQRRQHISAANQARATVDSPTECRVAAQHNEHHAAVCEQNCRRVISESE